MYYELLMRSITAISAAQIGPDPDGDDKDAPWIEDYVFVLQGKKMNMHGWVLGHPKHGTTYIQTSLLIHISQDQKWARTLSRWYKLGDARKLDTSQLTTDIDLAGLCMPIGSDAVTIPLSLARRITELRPNHLAGIAREKGSDDVSKTLSDLAKSWPPRENQATSD